jgi:hypothetical protein
MGKRLKIGLLLENPDIITTSTLKLTAHDEDAIGFGYYNGKFHITGLGSFHDKLKVDSDPNYITDRRDFELAGRIWLNEHIISFWDYPSVSELHRVLNDLVIAVKDMYYEDIDTNNLRIEVRDSNKNRLLMPIRDYQGSKSWSPEDKAKKHTEIGKGGESVPNGIGSRKAPVSSGWGSEAERRFKIGQIAESPDEVGSSYHSSDDAIPFGFHGGKFVMGDFGKAHSNISVGPKFYDTADRSEFEYAGRIWLNSGIISFWDYPSVSILKQILSDLDKSMEEMYDMNYNLVGSQDKLRIEVIPFDKVRDKSRLGWNWDADNSILIPVSEYTGSMAWSPDNRSKRHIEIGKGGESVPDGVGSRKYSSEIGNSNVTPAEYNYIRGVSESKKLRMNDLL